MSSHVKMDFKPFVTSSASGPRHDPHRAAKIARHAVFRDNFAISSWLCLGAVMQVLAYLLLPPLYAMTPAVSLLSFRFLRTMLMHRGVIGNSQMDGVKMGKFSAQIPGKYSEPPSQTSEQDVTVIILAARSNHALGIFGPGYRDVSNYLNAMVAELWEDADKYGFLGQTTWVAANERHTNNQVMVLCYFRSVEDLHAYAHGPLHRRAWTWWNSITKSHPHLSIMHEVYHAPKKQWENIFVNNHLTGIANMQARVDMEGQRVRPLVDASRGGFRSQLGRLGRGGGAENEVYGPEPY